MNDSKSIFSSKTVWGLVVILLGYLAPWMGMNFTAADGNELLTMIDEAMVIGGGVFALYGRVTATQTTRLFG